MAKKILTSLDLAKNEIQNARIQNLSSAPSSPVAGQVYYDTTMNKFGTYNGSTWDYMGTSTSSGDFSSNTATSVDGEVVVFSGTGGKTGKRATGTGIAKLTSGVLGTATSGTDYEVPLTFSTGLTRSTNTVSVNTTQNIAKLSNLTSNGLVKTSGGDGTLSVAASGTDYAPATSGTGVLKGNGSGGTATATSGTDYSAGTSALATGILKSTTSTGALTIATAGDFPTLNQNTTGSAATLTTSRNFQTNLASTSAAGFNGSADNTHGVTGTLGVANGGTGRATATTAYGLIAAGTTATGVQQTISPGTSGQFLKSAGGSALASFAAITQSDVTNLTSDLALKAPLASPTFTGTVTVPTPTNATDAASKGYVDNAVQGLSWKQAVRVATTATGTLASAYENGDTVDGITLATGDRILIKNQTTGSENGIYTVNASGAPTRATDADTSAEIDSMAVYVESGTANADTVWTLTTDNPTLGTTALVYTQVNGGTVPQASTTTQGKVELATQAETEAKSDTDRAVTPSGLATFTRTYTQTIGNGSSTSIGVTHSLGNQWVIAQIVEVSTLAEVECDVIRTSSSVTTFEFTTAPTTNQYRVIIVG